jgi:hypothetical protein
MAAQHTATCQALVMAAAPQPKPRGRRRPNRLVGLAAVSLLGAAVVKELRLPARKRRWHGRIGPVPYDLRPPDAKRVRERLWNPKGPLISPHVIGVGWTINLGRLWALARGR